MASRNTVKASYAAGIALIASIPGMPTAAKDIAEDHAAFVLGKLFNKTPVNVALDVIREQAALSLAPNGKTLAPADAPAQEGAPSSDQPSLQS